MPNMNGARGSDAGRRDEVKNRRHSTTQNDGGGKHVPYLGNADEKYQHAADGENRPCDAPANTYLRHVDLRTCSAFFHTAPSGTKLSQICAPGTSPRCASAQCTTTCQILRAPRWSYVLLPVKFSARRDGLMWGRLAACGRLLIGPASGARLRARRSRPRQPGVSRAVGLRLCGSAGQAGIPRPVGNRPGRHPHKAAQAGCHPAPQRRVGPCASARPDSSDFAGDRLGVRLHAAHARSVRPTSARCYSDGDARR